MTIKKIFFGTLAFLGPLSFAQAQYTKDVLLFSQQDNGGTARFRAMGGAATALGGDISSLTNNPAGLGYFNQSDASVTFRHLVNQNKSNYFGTQTTANNNNFNVDNAGVVLNMPTIKNGNLNEGWLNFNVGVAYNRNNIFNNKTKYSGTNPNNSITNFYADRTFNEQKWGDDFYNNSYMVDNDKVNLNDYLPIAYTSASGSSFAGPDQVNSIIEKGSKAEFALSFGSNYSNKFYIGGTVGFSSFNYENSSLFTEYGKTMTANDFSKINPGSVFLDPSKQENKFLNSDYEAFDHVNQTTTGTGIDFKLGMIYRVSPTFNLGFTAKTPTFYTVADETDQYTKIAYFKANANTSFYDFNTDKDIGYSYYEYQMQSPYRLSIGGSQIFNRGLITADVEWVDYKAMRFRQTDGNGHNLEDAMNASIKDNYKGALNFRLGGEVLLNQIFSARAGVNLSGNPYKNADYTNYTASLGLGAKLGSRFYTDLTGLFNGIKYNQNPYTIDENHWGSISPSAEIKNNRYQVLLTVGTKF